MDGRVRHELQRAIQRDGVGLTGNPQRIKSMLMDACPGAKMEIGLLVQAAEDGIPARLSRSSNSALRDSEMGRAQADLVQSRRLDAGAAHWVVQSWAWALGITPQQPPDQTGPTSTPGPGSYPQGQNWRSGPPYAPSGPGPGSFVPPSAPPWQPGGMGGGVPGQPGPGWQPGPSGPPPAGLPGPQWNPMPGPPIKRGGNGRIVAIFGAVAAVVVVLIVVLVVVGGGSPPPPDGRTGTVRVQIVMSIEGGSAAAVTATLFSLGTQIAELSVTAQSQKAQIAVPAQPGDDDYQLRVRYVLLDGTSGSCFGSGSFTAFEGAVLRITVSPDAGGGCRAALAAA